MLLLVMISNTTGVKYQLRKGDDFMKRIDVVLLFVVVVISVLLFLLLLQGKLSNGYIVLIILGFGLIVGFIRRFFFNNRNLISKKKI